MYVKFVVQVSSTKMFIRYVNTNKCHLLLAWPWKGGSGVAYRFNQNAGIASIAVKKSPKYRRYWLPGGLKVSILRPQSIDFSGAVSRIDFKKSAVSSIANNPLPGPLQYILSWHIIWCNKTFTVIGNIITFNYCNLNVLYLCVHF